MRNRSRKGVGSNQYMDKAQMNPKEAEDHAQRKREKERPLASAPIAVRRAPAETPELVKGMGKALDAHVMLLASGRELSPEEVIRSAEEIGRFEDDLLGRYQNMYGLALRDGVYFATEARLDPELRERARSEGTPEHALSAAYRDILDDANGDRTNGLTLEELAVNLDTLNSAIEARESGETEWHGGLEGEPSLSSQYAAASVFSSRDPEDSSLRQQVSALRNRLHEEGVAKINF